jgi:hypothetical protein
VRVRFLPTRPKSSALSLALLLTSHLTHTYTYTHSPTHPLTHSHKALRWRKRETAW